MENSDVMVSIYCLTYNHENYIRDALEGFVNQNTNFKYEVYVHDDASTDKTADIIKEYEKKYPRIIYGIYQKENQYSKGINIIDTYIKPFMKGKYIASCEGDDYWCDNNKLQKQVDILEMNPLYSACVHQTICVDCRSNKKKLLSIYRKNQLVEFKDVLITGSNAFHTSSIVAKRNFIINRPKFCYAIKNSGDYPLAIYLYFSGGIYFINEIMSVYRHFSGEHSWTNKFYKLQVSERKKHSEQCINMLHMADEYSMYEYHEEIEKVVSRIISSNNYNEYIKKVQCHDKGIIGNPKYRKFYKKESFKTKIWIGIRPYLPQLAVNFLKKFSNLID